MNSVLGDPLLEGVSMDFSTILDYVPGFSLGGYDYIANYITHHVYGVW